MTQEPINNPQEEIAKPQEEIKFPLDINGIKKIIPHRYPFLLIDRVDYCNYETKEVKGYKNVTANEPHFMGHFPEKPIMPGVLIIEALAQIGAVMTLSMPQNRGKIALLLGVNEAKFRRAVVPGDKLELEVKFSVLSSSKGKGVGVAKVGDQIAAQAEIMFAIAKGE